MAYNPSLAINSVDQDEITNVNRVRAVSRTTTITGGSVLSNPLGTAWIQGSGTPYSATSASSMPLTAANMLTGICVLKPSADVTLTFGTAANLVAALNAVTSGVQVGDCLVFQVINGAAANTLAPTAATGITFDANMATTLHAAGTSRTYTMRFTNVTSGAEAAVLYW